LFLKWQVAAGNMLARKRAKIGEFLHDANIGLRFSPHREEGNRYSAATILSVTGSICLGKPALTQPDEGWKIAAAGSLLLAVYCGRKTYLAAKAAARFGRFKIG
jgi:hypothetical protein